VQLKESVPNIGLGACGGSKTHQNNVDTAARSDAKRPRLNEIKGMVPSLFNLPAGCSFAPRCALSSDRCRTHKPPLDEQRPGHWIACWHADRVLAGAAAAAGAG